MKADLPETLREKALKMVGRLRRMAKFGSYSGEYELIEKYVDWIITIPWGSLSKDNLDLGNARDVLDRNHYGLLSVKERILEFLAVATLNPFDEITSEGGEGGFEKMKEMKKVEQHAPILCFVGIQGIGKTSMAKSIAHALGRKFVRISLGAMGSVTDLKGQSRAFLDAEPGQVIKALCRTGVMNPLILLDEIDKVSAAEGRRADINASLLEILDPEQNPSFIDSYIDYPVDLSRVLFICTANTLSTLSAALLDRLEIIRFPSYSDEEKEQIGRHYLLPKVMKACGLKQDQLDIKESTWPLVIRPLGFDAGVRQLERNITTICRKVAMKIVQGKGEKFTLTSENFREYLPADIGVYS
ncbi:AAA family ATPase [Candidatus Dojkabacteria bacterium]|nr:AAA family ATPase [Candidatus Dojkabacteria bacterium]